MSYRTMYINSPSLPPSPSPTTTMDFSEMVQPQLTASDHDLLATHHLDEAAKQTTSDKRKMYSYHMRRYHAHRCAHHWLKGEMLNEIDSTLNPIIDAAKKAKEMELF